MNQSARKAMYRNMVTSLMLHGQIRTTQARAKELRGYAEKVITLGKNAPSVESCEGLSGEELAKAKAVRVPAIRRARRWVNNADAMEKIFGEYASRFAERAGGYTRVVKAGWRAGDNADMAIIQLVGSEPSSVAVESDDAADADESEE
jgi:large subunit ribosomal protein L17